jgi:hypothetical protein
MRILDTSHITAPKPTPETLAAERKKLNRRHFGTIALAAVTTTAVALGLGAYAKGKVEDYYQKNPRVVVENNTGSDEGQAPKRGLEVYDMNGKPMVIDIQETQEPAVNAAEPSQNQPAASENQQNR